MYRSTILAYAAQREPKRETRDDIMHVVKKWSSSLYTAAELVPYAGWRLPSPVFPRISTTMLNQQRSLRSDIYSHFFFVFFFRFDWIYPGAALTAAHGSRVSDPRGTPREFV